MKVCKNATKHESTDDAKARGNEQTKATTNLFAPEHNHLPPNTPPMARSQSQPSQREDGEPVVRRLSPRKSVTGGSAPVLSGGYLQRHSSKVRNYFFCVLARMFIILRRICATGIIDGGYVGVYKIVGENWNAVAGGQGRRGTSAGACDFVEHVMCCFFVSAGLFDATGPSRSGDTDLPSRAYWTGAFGRSTTLLLTGRHGHGSVVTLVSRACTHRPASFRVIPPMFYVGISTNLRSEEFLTFGHFEFS